MIGFDLMTEVNDRQEREKRENKMLVLGPELSPEDRTDITVNRDDGKDRKLHDDKRTKRTEE